MIDKRSTLDPVYDTLLHKPRNSGRFSSLMELYERNYLLVRLLIPELREMGEGLYVSRPAGAMALELSAIEHSRFTTTFNLSYRFSGAEHSPSVGHKVSQRKAREPDLVVRIYHDARTCEVMSGLIPSSTNESRRVRDLLEGHRLNRFLDKWLNYCLRQGHGFGAGVPECSSPAVPARATGPVARSGALPDPVSGL